MVIRVPASVAVVAAAAITRDVVFVKRDKNSKRDPINREGNATGFSHKSLPDENGKKQSYRITESRRIFFIAHVCFFNTDGKRYIHSIIREMDVYKNVFLRKNIIH